jgi:hypothetical protein
MEELLRSDAFLVFLFVVPGFVAAKVSDLLVPGDTRNWSESLVEVISLGAINFALFGPVLMAVARDAPARFSWWRYLVWIAFMLVTPTALAVAWWRFRTRGAGTLIPHPLPKGWDHFFYADGSARSCRVVCHFKDGRRAVGGTFEGGSFASSYPAAEDLYIEQVWSLDEKCRFMEPIIGTMGMLVRREDCELIEFFEIPKDEAPEV